MSPTIGLVESIRCLLWVMECGDLKHSLWQGEKTAVTLDDVQGEKPEGVFDQVTESSPPLVETQLKFDIVPG